MEELQLKRKKSFENRIDFFGLQDSVVEQRNAGKSYVAIARALNKNNQQHLQGIVITPKMVGDWCRSNLVEEKVSNKEYEVVNTYNEQKNLLEMVETQIEMIQVFIDDLQCQQAEGTMSPDILYKRMKDLMSDQEKYFGRKQAILKDMQATMEKIFTFQAMNSIIVEIMRIITEKDPKLADQITKEMKTNQILLSNYAKIQQN